MINESLIKCIIQYSYSIVSVVFRFFARAQKPVSVKNLVTVSFHPPFSTSHIIFIILLIINFSTIFFQFLCVIYNFILFPVKSCRVEETVHETTAGCADRHAARPVAHGLSCLPVNLNYKRKIPPACTR